MESVKKWLNERSAKKNGLYVHYSPPKLVGVVSAAQLRQWARGGAESRLERAVLAGQGRRLLAEAETLPIAKHLPNLVAKCDALHMAVERGSLAELQELLDSDYNRRKYVLCRDEAGVGLLHKAVFYDYTDIVEYLVKNYPQLVHQKDSEGRTPLHYVSVCRDEASVAALLEGAGAARGARDAAGRTPAAYRGARTLLALPTVDDMARETAKNPPGLVIKRHNIRIWCHDCDMARLQRVVWEGHGTRLLSEVSSQPVVKKFLEAVPYIMNTIRDIHNAVIDNDLEGLMKHAGDPVPPAILSSRDGNNMTVLHKAAGLGHGGILKYITDRYPQGINDVDNDGRTPLHYAAAVRDDQHAYNTLVGLGADESIVDNKNKTPGYYINRSQEIDKNLLKALPDAPRTASSAYPSSWDWKLLDTEVIVELNKKSRRRNLKASTENLSSKNNSNTISEPTDSRTGVMKASSTQEHIKDLPELDESSKFNNESTYQPEPQTNKETEEDKDTEINKDEKDETHSVEDNKEQLEEKDAVETLAESTEEETQHDVSEDCIETAENVNEKVEEPEKGDTDNEQQDDDHEKEIINDNENTNEDAKENVYESEQNPTQIDAEEEINSSNYENDFDSTNLSENPRSAAKSARLRSGKSRSDSQNLNRNDIENTEEETEAEQLNEDSGNQIETGNEINGRNSQESLIEGIVRGSAEQDSQDASVTQRDDLEQGKLSIVDNEIDPEVTELINTANMEMLATLVLNGEGSRLIGRQSGNTELQAFLANVPTYMQKIHKVHLAAKEGNLKDLQAALDRRKFAIARDPVSPNGSTPLHVATVFGKTNIMKYLGGRFPETLSAVDFEGRTALHYAAVLPDNGHYYNLLQQLGANSKDLDDNGKSAEDYFKDPSLLPFEQLLTDFGLTEEEVKAMFSDKGPSNGHMDIPAFKTEEGRYLAKSLGDPLIKGLTEVANVKPKDPVAFLASFLQNFPESEKPLQMPQESNLLVTQEAAEVENEEAPAAPAPVEELSRPRTAARTATKPHRPIDVITVDPQPVISPDAPETAFSSVNRDEHGQSMLHFAAARTHARNALFQLLQESEISLAYRDELYRTARDVSIQANVPENTAEIDKWVLHLAARGNKDKIMELLLEGYDHILDVVDEEGVSITDVVTQRDDAEMKNLLTSIPSFEESRESLHSAVRRGDMATMQQILSSENGKNLARSQNSFGRTSLHIAVLAQHEDIVEHLAQNYPELLRIGDNLERTPLHYAMGVEKIESLSRVLIKAGSKRVLKDLKGRQPSYYFMNKSDILRLKEEEEVF